MAENKSIKFPDKHYVGFQARPSVDDVPLGFMTPFGTDKAFEKRKSTVDSWASGGGYYAQNNAKDKLPAQTYDNKPMVGFKLGRNIRHGYGWGQGNVKWRIEDPRGFELEITSPNLAQIMGFCTIEQGEILEECIWARFGAENVLVPVNSDVYENAFKNTERMKKTASMKGIKIGDSVVMHNGEQGIYYGAFYVTSRSHQYGSNYSGYRLELGTKKRHVFLMKGADGLTSTKFFRAIGSPKLAELYEGDSTMTHEEAEREIARLVREENHTLHESTTGYASPIAFTIEPMEESAFVLERVNDTIANIKARHKKANYYVRELVHSAQTLMDINGKPCIFDLGDYFNRLEFLPGGSNHNQVVQWNTHAAANPTYYNGKSHSYYNLTISELHEGCDPSVDGKILTKGSVRYSSFYRDQTTVLIDEAPTDFYYFRWAGKSAAGTEITCYI